MSNITDILNKYSSKKNKSNNAFVALSGGYNPDEIDNQIEEFNNEYDKQLIASEKFKDSEKSLEKCKQFTRDYKDKIYEQAEQLNFIVNQLPNLIISNKEQSMHNQEMNELINSDEYVELTNKLRNIKTNVAKIKNFLLKEGIHDF
jgi:chromatin segregation and condensation protein Rec8/ScpA/Scc1 (kleisin family)